MARTSDPHAATVKAWQTRARASASDVRQQSGDFGRVAGVAGERLDLLDRIRTMTQKDSGEERLLNPLSDQSAARFAATYLAKKSQILAKLGASGLSASKVAAVASRIDRAASGLSWADLMGWNDGPSMRDQGS